jgi:hypothetical protein
MKATHERSCLRCDKRFMSLGPGNRLCKTCTAVLYADPSPEPIYPVYRQRIR